MNSKTNNPRPANRKSKLYGMRLYQAKRIPDYDYGVSHISKRTGMKFIQRKSGSGYLAMRVK